jgi:histone acetyltransferase
MLDAQRTFILQHVKKHANSHTVYDPLPKEFSPNVEGVSRANLVAAQAMAIPGIIDAGWTLNDLIEATGVGKETDRQKGALKSELLALVRKIQEQQFAWPFREPVDTR